MNVKLLYSLRYECLKTSFSLPVMMVVYSHSRLSCYEQCPYKYKLKYIDKVESEIAASIEAFLGSLVHDTLEKLYRDFSFHKVNTLDELLTYFREEWKKNFNDDILIVKDEYTPENYLQMGEQFITDYYQRYYPFDHEKTIAIEDQIIIDLDGSGEYKLQGFIDRLAEKEEGYYEIHDYKTNSRLPLPQHIKTDRQLALYAIGVKLRYPDVKDVRLVWHFLKFDKEIDSTRTNAELERLKKETIRLIDKIEQTTSFPTNQSMLCNWCEYKPICKQWSHLYQLQEKTEKEYSSDSGLQLVDRYEQLKKQKKQLTLDLYAEIDKIEEQLVQYAEQNDIDVVFGSNCKVRLKTQQQYKFPSRNSVKRKELVEILKQHGKWNEVDQLDTTALNNIIKEKQWDEPLLQILQQYVLLEESKRLYLSNNKEGVYYVL
jgi:putative RecB family exonuclease